MSYMEEGCTCTLRAEMNAARRDTHTVQNSDSGPRSLRHWLQIQSRERSKMEKEAQGRPSPRKLVR